jgi:putative oxidoreductase
MANLYFVRRWHDAVFRLVAQLTDGWFLGFFARFVFFAVLYFYFLNSFHTKVGEGLSGFFSIQPGAWYQIAPFAVDAAGGDIDQISVFPWGVMVALGTYMEFLLPLMIVIGLFTRVAALGMIGFILVQSIVDVFVHMVDPQTVGALFDRFPDGLVVDQRLLWIFPLVYLVLNGGGTLSVDAFLVKALPNPSGRNATEITA